MLTLDSAREIVEASPYPFARYAKAGALLESFEATERAAIYLEAEVSAIGRLLVATRRRIEEGHRKLGIDPARFRESYRERGWDVENAPEDFFGPPREAYS